MNTTYYELRSKLIFKSQGSYRRSSLSQYKLFPKGGFQKLVCTSKPNCLWPMPSIWEAFCDVKDPRKAQNSFWNWPRVNYYTSLESDHPFTYFIFRNIFWHSFCTVFKPFGQKRIFSKGLEKGCKPVLFNVLSERFNQLFRPVCSQKVFANWNFFSVYCG